MKNNQKEFIPSHGIARRVLLLLLFVCISTSIFAQSHTNIILIVSDDQGYNDIGAYGNEEIHTPNLDRLADEGVKGTNFYVTGPGCTPSRSGFLTGRYPQRNGLYDMIRNDWAPRRDPEDALTPLSSRRQPEMTLGLDEKEYLISDMLKKTNYTNGIFGKWDFGRAQRYLPLQRGFDDFMGIVNTGTDYWTHERYGMPSLYRNNELVKEEGFLVEKEGNEAERFIHENHDRPFFLYYPSFAPHIASNLIEEGIAPPQEYLNLYPDRDPLDRQTEHMAAISAMDAQVGKILDLVDEYGIAENTLIVFFSDQGSGMSSNNSPLSGGKGNLWEGGVHVPFIARWPGVIPAGSTTDAFLSSLELVPTFAAVADTWTPDATMDGFNMMPVLKGEAESERTEMFWEWHGQRAARIGDYKWLDIDGDKGGLFDLTNDIGEHHDLSDEKPEVLANIKASWNDWRREMESAEPRGPFLPWNEYMRELHNIGHGPVHHWLKD
ncbi:MAG: sulfatase-like hydrolase/transferase [Balneolales bacterium]